MAALICVILLYSYNPPLECSDSNKNCAYWAGIGECERNPTYMTKFCKKSCAVCYETVCEDIAGEHCPLWAELGECEKNPYYMLANCQRSCRSCIIDINDCDPNPCRNGGTCFDGSHDYNCTCTLAYTGKSCDEEVDECLSNPCMNGGTCHDKVGSYNCTCAAGWTGHSCNRESDECLSNPCMNGATCVDQLANYTCQCIDGWTGRNCDIDFDECFSQPCQNGGSCYHGAGRFLYVCHCPHGWKGRNCELDVDECLSNPCINGATCENGKNLYTCKCPVGFEGLTCESGPMCTMCNMCHTPFCGDPWSPLPGSNGRDCYVPVVFGAVGTLTREIGSVFVVQKHVLWHLGINVISKAISLKLRSIDELTCAIVKCFSALLIS
uniref:Neurogenic locus notch homolog protein 1-like n=1 Tax=Saccoglossus kowalevskii TaxID=10224 RepID=A0ABM0MID7_SACKO|nr:PREDICTED: neurogenic locus notch homolog protein 1-like [Saccoglossus kowalevskii]